MTELVTVGETPIRLTPPGTRRLETAAEAELHADGTESNVAVAAQSLGTAATWLSKLPESPLGRRVVSQLHQHDIETEITWVPADAGRVGLTFHEFAATPREPGTWHDRADTTAATLSPADIPIELIRDAEVIFSGASTAALSDTSIETAEAVLRAGGESGARTALTIDYQPGLTDPDHLRETVVRLCEDLDVLVAKEADIEAVLGRTGKPRELANSLLASYELEMIVITRREFGAVVMADTPGTNVIHERDAVETETVDTSGQHGAFVGGFLQRLIDGADAAEALNYGVAMATLARTVPGPLLSVDRPAVDSLAAAVEDASR